MNYDLTTQMYMIMGLSQMGLNFNNNLNNDKLIYIKSLLPIMIIFYPFIIKILNFIYEWIEDYIYPDLDKIVSIKFPVHEIRVHKESYKSDSSIRQLYSINYLAINNYIRDNLDKIIGISNLTEILNVNMDYYSDDTNERNFFFIPSDSSEILIEPEKKIYCKIISTEKKNDVFNEGTDNGIKNKTSSDDKVKTYILIIFCKADSPNNNITNEEKKIKMMYLNKFITSCVIKYNAKNDEKYEGKHWIYEYTHSFKDEFSGLEQKFKEYLFENNKDLDTNIFFEGKEKLIKYVDKFIYTEEVENNIYNKYEEEYKSIGYTYKATFLLYGFPGCGKTSTIKAILNRTKRHGIIINLNKIKTCEELETLFRNRIINHREYNSRELCYIIEDCDAFENNILLSRKKDCIDDYDDNDNDNDNYNDYENIEETKSNNSFNVINKNELSDIDMSKDNNENKNIIGNHYNGNDDNENNEDDNINQILDKQITLIKEIKKSKTIGKKTKIKLGSIESIFKKMGKISNNNLNSLKYGDDSLNLTCLLNILDGIIELHGIMVIFTTNHPEKLDEAFLRPGRIDFKQEFKRANINTIKSIINSKFKLDNHHDFESSQFIDYVLSPAEIQSICFKCENINDCIKELLDEQKKNIFRINKK
jgi:hypothetical protein